MVKPRQIWWRLLLMALVWVAGCTVVLVQRTKVERNIERKQPIDGETNK